MYESFSEHLPVLLDAVVELLAPPREGAPGLYVDGTLGLGGHASAMEARGYRIVGIDRDAWALSRARTRLGAGAELHHAPFSSLVPLLAGRRPDAILLDLGVSSPQLDRAERGFSFRADGPLDMRMDPDSGAPLSELLATLGEAELADVLYRYGEERQSRRIARAIRAALPITRTAALAEVIARAVGGKGPIHPATRSFQALRIWINRELDELEHALEVLPAVLAPGGRLGIIAFHSLEDRLVKQAFSRLSGDGAPVDLYGNPLTSPAFRLVERRARKGEDRDPNPRARSARLRVLERNS